MTARKPADPTFREGLSGPRKVLLDAREYLDTEATAGVVLVGVAVVALVWANLLGDSYERFWAFHLALSVGDWSVDMDLRHWVDAAPMTLFFFVVALEIKRELLDGELKGMQRASLPAIAAVGGMVVPALLYLVVNAGGSATGGWGIPVATDIAFALGVVALVAPNLPQAARVFLLSLAIVDDVGAILVIAFVYSSGLEWSSVALAVVGLAAILALRRIGVSFWPLFLLIGVGVWVATLESGMNPTIAGVALGFCTPVLSREGRPSAGEWLEDKLHPWTSFLVLPVFALANAGFEISGATLGDAVSSRISLGIVLGLLVGKPLGICGAVFLATRFKWTVLPTDTKPRDIAALGMVAGIGFTVSLFVADLAFQSEGRVREATIGVALASVAAAVLGAAALRRGGHGRGKING